MSDITCEDIVFRPHYLGYLIVLGVALGLGAACVGLAAQLHLAWLGGVALAAGAALALASRYAAGSIIIRGLDLVIVQGAFITREVSLPIWEARLEIRQGLLGRLLDEGVVAQQIGGKRIVARVAQLRALRRLVAERRLSLLGLAEQPLLLTLAQQPRVIAGEIGDRRGPIHRQRP